MTPVFSHDAAANAVDQAIQSRQSIRDFLPTPVPREILTHLLEHTGVMAARVSTRKPDVYPDCEAVGVEVFRAKPGVM